MGYLQREELDSDPFREFARWFGVACESDLNESNAMSLATAASNGVVSVRTVLLKYWDSDGFVFFTNYASRKARQIEENANVGLLFYWPTLHRQIRIEGTATRVSMKESLTYFATRPRGSQLGAWSSAQSSVVSSRAVLQAKFAEVKEKFMNREIPLPSMWGGYRVVARHIEFWQRGEDRLHDRFLYELDADGTWTVQRLAP